MLAQILRRWRLLSLERQHGQLIVDALFNGQPVQRLETWQCAIFTKRRFSAQMWLTRTSPGANFHIGGRVSMQLFTYEIMSEIIGFDPREGLWCVFTVKNVLLCNFLTYMDVSACKFSHERTCLYTTCPIISYVWARPTCFHAVRRLQDVFMRVFTH